MGRASSPEGEVFGRRLRELRTKRRLTQGELGEKSGLTVAYISQLEHGYKVPSLTSILRLADALGCKVTALTSIFDQIDLPAILRS